MEDTTVNQGQTSNNNEIDSQYQKALEELKEEIEKIKNKKTWFKKSEIYDAFSNFISKYVSKNKELTDLIKIASETIEYNSEFASVIVNAFTEGCLDKEKGLEDINAGISDIINADKIKDKPDLVSDIIDTFVKIYLRKKSYNMGLESLIDETYKIIEKNQKFASGIIRAFTQVYLGNREDLGNIGNGIAKIIDNDGIRHDSELVSNIIDGFIEGCINKEKDFKYIGSGISEIIDNDKIKRSGLVSNIIDAFVKGYLTQKPNNMGLESLIDETSETIEKNQEFASGIIRAFTQGRLNEGEDLGNIITNISDIIETRGREDNPDLVSNIISGFIKGYLDSKPRDFQLLRKLHKELIDIAYEIIKKNKRFTSAIINGFTQGCIYREAFVDDISYKIVSIIQKDEIKGDKDSVFNIIKGCTQGCINEKKDCKDIVKDIFYIIEQGKMTSDKDSVFNIIKGFTQGCIDKEGDLGKIGTGIAKIIDNDVIKKDLDLVPDIIKNFTQSCIDKKEDLGKIGTGISKIIDNNKIKEDSTLVSNIIESFTQSFIDKKEDFEKIGTSIFQIINADGIKGNEKLVSDIIRNFTQSFLNKKEDFEKIGTSISQIINADEIKGNEKLVYNIIDSFIQGCFNKRKSFEKIGTSIFQIINADKIKGNKNLVYNIIGSFTQSCIEKNEKLEDIGKGISEIINNDKIKKDSELVSNIINAFTQVCIDREQKWEDISKGISEIINNDKIKKDLDLVFNIINGFVQSYLMKKPDNIKEITEGFSNLLNGTEDKIKEKVKPIFSLIVSQHFMNTLINSSNEQLSEEEKERNKEDAEKQLLECYNKLPHEGHNGEINSFQDIPLKELSKSQEEYLKEKFKEYGNMDSGGKKYETFLKTACNLIFKSEGNEELTIENLEDKKGIFKDLKFIDLIDNDGIESKEKLFKAIGLQETDFGNEREGDFSDFSIVYCSFLKHGFVMIIDKTKEWEKAKDPKTESIYLIDSSGFIKAVKDNPDLYPELNPSLKKKNDIFNSTPTLNKNDYQENSTCWLNTMSAIGFLLEKQQEAKQKQEQQEQVEQTEQHEQQPRKPYGLSISELLEGFNKTKNDKSKEITELNTQSKGLSTFERGICDYSTENFYPLTNMSPEEKAIIKEFLIEKNKQNKAEQKELSILSSQLEQLEYKNLIIQGKYLKESLERITKNDKKLKELCDKFGFDIKDIQCNKKRKFNIFNIFSSCISSNSIKGQTIQNTTERNKTSRKI